MPYTDAVIKEVMRLYGIVDGIWRQTLEDITIQGHHIPKVSAPKSLQVLLSFNTPSYGIQAKRLKLCTQSVQILLWCTRQRAALMTCCPGV